MARLFLSYNRKDSPYAWAIRQWLTDDQGWAEEDIFFDATHLYAGVDWEPKLLAEAEGAEVMLFLASDHSLNQDSFCYRELKHATGQVLAVTVGGVGFDDKRLDRALPHYAKSRQVTQLDKSPTEPFPYLSPVDGETSGTVELNAACIQGIRDTLRELGVAPNSYSWTPKGDDDSPFPGLRPLREGDEALFCGRDLEIRNGIKALEDLRTTITKRVLVIQAPSGAGKSSFLRAGLWHRLRCNPGFTPLAIIRTPNNALRNQDWGLVTGLFHTLRRSPKINQSGLALARQEIASLAESDLPALLARFADADAGESGRRTLLIGIDQAEEMTALAPEDDALLDQLLKSLLTLPGDLDLRLVLTARDDSIDATLARLAKAGLTEDQVESWRLHRIPPSRLDDIINGPAEAARRAEWPITFETGLVDALVHAAGEGDDSADALPILAITLQRMAAACRAPDGRITLQPEQAKTFVENVVSDTVDEALKTARATRDDLRTLVIPGLASWDPDAGSEGAAKRQVTVADTLFSGRRAGLRPLADELVNQRLLTRSQTDAGPAYEVTHEALLRVPPLGDMILDCRETFEQVRILEIETREWVSKKKSTASLVRTGGRLEDAFALMDDADFGADLLAKKVAGDTRVKDYLDACRVHENRLKKRSRRVWGTVVAVLSVLLVAAVWMSLQAVEQRNNAYVKDASGARALAIAAKEGGNRYPDQIFHRLRAIGFVGYPRELPENQPKWKTALATGLSLFREEEFPVLVKPGSEPFQQINEELEQLGAYLPFWRTRPLGLKITALAVSHDHRYLAAGFADGSVRIWDSTKLLEEPAKIRQATDKPVEKLGYEVYTNRLRLREEGAENYSVWDGDSWPDLSEEQDQKDAWIDPLRRDAPEIDQTHLTLESFVGDFIQLRDHPDEVTATAFSLDGFILYAGLKNGMIVAWDIRGDRLEPADLLSYFAKAGSPWFTFSDFGDAIDSILPEQTRFQRAPKRSLLATWRESQQPVTPGNPKESDPFINSLGMSLVHLKKGTFTMGSKENENDDETLHKVTLSRGFWIGKHEVTQKQWTDLMGHNPSSFTAERVKREGKELTAEEIGNLPVENVSWYDAVRFCRMLTFHERAAGRIPQDWQYRLPTDAEWEYACRAGTTGTYNVDGVELKDLAWYSENSGDTTHPVGRKQANAWGLHDMHGNVWEWCQDWYQGELGKDTVTDPPGPDSGGERVYRGGSWSYSAPYCRSAFRIRLTPDRADFSLGFRVALSSSASQDPAGRAGTSDGGPEASAAAPDKPERVEASRQSESPERPE